MATLRLEMVICMNEGVSEVAQLCPTLCDPIDGSPPGSAAPGILQAGTLEWVAISFWRNMEKLLQFCIFHAVQQQSIFLVQSKEDTYK